MLVPVQRAATPPVALRRFAGLINALKAKMGAKTVRILDVETIARNKGKLVSVSYDQRRRDGEQQSRKREIYDNGNSAVILPTIPVGRPCCSPGSCGCRFFLQDGVERTVEACAGKLDGETPERRIMKEMQEELGYRVSNVQRLFELYVSPAAVMEKVVFFTCAYSPANKVSDGGGLKEEGEDIDVIETPLEEAAAMIATGQIVDAKTVVLVQYLSHRIQDAARR
jgi:8-oxo-dGTP pyrophosphatase MutT (NUDIX family)